MGFFLLYIKGNAMTYLMLFSEGPQEKRLTILYKYCRCHGLGLLTRHTGLSPDTLDLCDLRGELGSLGKVTSVTAFSSCLKIRG